MLLEITFLGHEIGYNTIKPFHSKTTTIHKLFIHMKKPHGTAPLNTSFFQKLKSSRTSDTELTIRNTKHAFLSKLMPLSLN